MICLLTALASRLGALSNKQASNYRITAKPPQYTVIGCPLMVTVLIIAAVVIYFLPSIVAISRSVPNAGSVIVLNLFLGWTLIGWVMSLAMSFRSAQIAPQVNLSVAHQFYRPPRYPSPAPQGYWPTALPSTPPPYYATPQQQRRPVAGLPYNPQTSHSLPPQHRYTAGYSKEVGNRNMHR